MNNFVVSIYPERCKKEKITEYLEFLQEQGIKNIFISMINYVKYSSEERKEFDEMLKRIGDKGFNIYADIDQRILKELNISVFNSDLSFFKERFIKRIRLDYQMDGLLEAVLSKNNFGIEISLNASTNTTHYIKNVISKGADIKNLIASHNFYPEEFTGLDFKQFKRVTKEIKELGLRTSAFISHTASANAEGPLYRKCGDLPETMPTIEYLRTLPLEIQANYYFSSGIIDEIVLSTQFLNEKEFTDIKRGLVRQKTLYIEPEKTLSPEERKIIDYDKIMIREDIGQNLIRCSFTAYIFRNENIVKRDFKEKIIPRGSIVIPNNDYHVYKGEVEIVKEDIPFNGLRNVIGRITQEQMFMINEIKPYDIIKFKLK